MSAVHIPRRAIRDYFFVTTVKSPGAARSRSTAPSRSANGSLGELRLAYRVRRMEFRQAKAQKSEVAVIERAYNMLADPELRAVYETLMSNPETPTPFPYSGFGSVLVEGEQAKEGDVFFARRILAFLPELRRHTLTLPLRARLLWRLRRPSDRGRSSKFSSTSSFSLCAGPNGTSGGAF